MKENDLNDGALLRDTNFLNVLFILLLNSSVQNQISMLYELNLVLKMDCKNQRVLVSLGYHKFLLGIISTLKDKYLIQSTSLNKTYIDQLVNLVVNLLAYGYPNK